MNATAYCRTMYGSHRHVDPSCANHRRALGSGRIIFIPAEEVANWAPCAHCCPTEVTEHAANATKKPVADGYCLNTVPVAGSYNPRRYQVRGSCKTCGATGVSMTKTMNLRKHRLPV